MALSFRRPGHSFSLPSKQYSISLTLHLSLSCSLRALSPLPSLFTLSLSLVLSALCSLVALLVPSQRPSLFRLSHLPCTLLKVSTLVSDAVAVFAHPSWPTTLPSLAQLGSAISSPVTSHSFEKSYYRKHAARRCSIAPSTAKLPHPGRFQPVFFSLLLCSGLLCPNSAALRLFSVCSIPSRAPLARLDRCAALRSAH